MVTERLRFTALVLSFAISLGLLPARTAADAPIVVKLGVDLPLSGIDGASAVPARNAILLAIEEANRRGFPGGARVDLDDLDDTVQGNTIRLRARRTSAPWPPTRR